MKWSRYLNGQHYKECQVVSSINCLTFYTGKTIKSKSDEYERLVNFCGARRDGPNQNFVYGTIYPYLGLKKIRQTKRMPMKHLGIKPVEVGIRHPKTGYHSVVIVDRKDDKIRVTNLTNFTHARFDGWCNLDWFLRLVPKYDDNFYNIIGKKRN